jgi:hypothetical protein
MNKVLINVPTEIRYISEWGSFDISLLKNHSIINKTLTGCGFTHYCLTNPIPTILCSPRKFLLENKYSQLPETYLVVNSGEKNIGIDQDIENFKSKPDLSDHKISNLEEIYTIKNNLSQYLLSCQLSQKTPKILVTYDSLKHVLDTLGSTITNFSIIVDEFQNIFIDSRFKADIEMNFLRYLQDCPNVTYLSATPMLDNYLNELDEFKNLPYYEFVWDPSKIIKADVVRKKVISPYKEISNIINNYRNGIFPRKVLEGGSIYESKEVVFYVNSVKMICSIIKKNNLQPGETNIICSRDRKNIDKLRKLGHIVGTAPLKGDPHKMFTFCTRTVYSGADFYSTNASTIIVSDCNISSLSVDIRMDLPQIMGRQRLDENVFKYDALLLYSLSDKEVTMDKFHELEKEKLINTNRDLISWNNNIHDSEGKISVITNLRLKAKVLKYLNDYTGIDEKTGQPVENKLVRLSERRAFELQSSTYKDDISLYNELYENYNLDQIENQFEIDLNLEYQIFLQDFGIDNNFERRMRLYCDFIKKFYNILGTTNIQGVPQEYQNYMNLLGPDRIKTLRYYQAELEREYKIIISGNTIKESILVSFQVSQKYTLKEIKEKLREIYTTLGLSKTPKAKDLEEYYEVKKTKITTSDGVRDGYKLLNIKS